MMGGKLMGGEGDGGGKLMGGVDTRRHVAL